MYLEFGLILFGGALFLLVLFCIPILLKLWRAASDVTVTLQALNERLPIILKNMEDISANINQSTTAINAQVQQYADTAQRFQRVASDVATTVELISPLALKSPLFRRITALIPVVKGIKVFLKVLADRERI